MKFLSSNFRNYVTSSTSKSPNSVAYKNFSRRRRFVVEHNRSICPQICYRLSGIVHTIFTFLRRWRNTAARCPVTDVFANSFVFCGRKERRFHMCRYSRAFAYINCLTNERTFLREILIQVCCNNIIRTGISPCSRHRCYVTVSERCRKHLPPVCTVMSVRSRLVRAIDDYIVSIERTQSVEFDQTQPIYYCCGCAVIMLSDHGFNLIGSSTYTAILQELRIFFVVSKF